jgi:hypothetical protein
MGKRHNSGHDKWLNGSAPIDLAPNLYKLARYKSRMAEKELRNKRWMGVAHHINSREQLVEFIKLWNLIKSINLREYENDHIQWKWIAIEVYSTASAYHLQFQGSYPPFQTGKLWKTKTEEKDKNFGWTTMHQRIPTVETFTSCGMGPNQTCSLCNVCNEDARHLLTECPHMAMVWPCWYSNPGVTKFKHCGLALPLHCCGQASASASNYGYPSLHMVECVKRAQPKSLRFHTKERISSCVGSKGILVPF